MFVDPIFLLSIFLVFCFIAVWIYQVLQNTLTDQSQQILYIAGLSASLIAIYRIFVNAGDLGSVLLIGSIMCLIILLVGIFKKNTLLKATGRGWFVPVFLIFILRTFAYEPYQIPSGSMIPGLKVGDFILVNKHSYGLKINRIGNPFALSADPEYGDVVVFIPPHVNVPYIKRLIGKPGDQIGYLNKKIYVNGKAIEQEFISSTEESTLLKETLGASERIIRIVGGSASYPEEFVVPANHYFVMGDNRDNSSDSRYWGFVPRENFMGTGELIWMTWECWTCLPSFNRAGFIQ
jgi:signal peptidase I